MRVRRRRICFVQIADQLLPDLGALFRGEMRMDAQPQAELLCPVSGERIAVDAESLSVLARIPAEHWVEAGQLVAEGVADEARLQALVERRLLLAEDDPASQKIADDEARLEQIGWLDLTAVYHAMTRWSHMEDDVARREHTPEAHRGRLENVAQRHGAPPTHFPRRADALSRQPLQLPAFDSPLARILRARRTTRVYDREAWLPKAEFEHMLYGCFGAMGTLELASDTVAVKRTSASGGSLHPTEAYPIVFRVEGLRSGIYHYDAGSHALELLEEAEEDELRSFMTAVTAGQHYFADAHAMIVHVARFARHHWKYRRHAKAYKALLMDSAHLSQTFYLLATERGLGAFYTAAINDAELAPRLGLDPLAEAPVGISGVGVKGAEHAVLHFNPEPYTPRFED